jgi:hypothetical protein
VTSRPRSTRCKCAQCQALDAAHPGEGTQLAFPIKLNSRRKAARRAKSATQRSALS